ncbi:MAG: hypothetical protein H8D23_16670 [Candidatus Brocadiales bacterium]|nr:hypothetical protein [Candidatus Brocadiales bacterium]
MKAAQTFKIDLGPPSAPKSVSQKFKPYRISVYSNKPKWLGKEGDYKEDGHMFKELCALCGKAFGDHFDNHCFNGNKENGK